MIKLSSITLLSIIIVGCASTPPVSFWKKADTPLNTAQDAYSKCKYDIGMNKVSKDQEMDLVANCMQMQGYRMGKYYR